MDNNFDSLLKTNTIPSSDIETSEDVLKNPKIKIKKICINLCLPAQKYDPSKTVASIQSYLKDKSTKERILYSEISSYVYGLTTNDQGNFATNLECLLTYVFEESNLIDKDICKIVIKIYDHFQLAVNQKNLNSDTNDVIKTYLIESIEDAKKAIKESAENATNIEKEYITILGIFASIVLAFVGGLTFSTSVLQNIDAISIYRLIFMVDLIAMVLVNAIYLLMKFICDINDKKTELLNGKKTELISVKWFNIVFGIIGVLVIAAWAIDFNALVEFIRVYLPWIK